MCEKVASDWGLAVVITYNLHHLKLPSHNLAESWQKKRRKQNYKLLRKCFFLQIERNLRNQRLVNEITNYY